MSRKLRASICATVAMFALSIYLSKHLHQVEQQIADQHRYEEKKRYCDRIELWISRDDQKQIKDRLTAKQ